MNRRNHRIGLGHPMQRGIGKDCVECPLKGERSPAITWASRPRARAAATCRRAPIDTDNARPRLQLPRERAVTAAEIKDSFSGIGRQPFQDSAAKGRNVAGIQ
ncbi:MAG: hypothetical protein ACI82H_000896, partial [Alphaproteobacteria bacterium]